MKKLIMFVQSMSLLVMIQSALLGWDPPIGIPRPEFGIEETYRMYDDPENRNPALTYTQNGEGGFYTHYIDNTHPNATDVDNLYGTAGKPRNTIPRDLTAGSVVEIHGGSYEPNYANKIIIKGTGTKEQPVFIRGISELERPVFTGLFHPQGSYVIVENLYFNNIGLVLRVAVAAGLYGPVDHIAVRYCEFEGDGIPTEADAIVIFSNDAEPLKTDIVIYNNHIHHYGDYQASSQNDACGVAVSHQSERVWVVDNHIHHNGGDSFQVDSPSAKDIYVGRNIMHNERENAIDLKACADVIISENEMYGFVATSSSGGNALRVNDEGAKENIWIIYNTIYDSVFGIDPIHSPFPPYIIGNIIYDCYMGIQRGSGYVINNVVYNTDIGIRCGNNVINNIVHKASTWHLYEGTNVHHNLFWQDGDAITFKEVTSADSIEADPLFVDPANCDFRLQPTSLARDAGTSSGVVQEVFDRFEQRYGIDIRVDIAGGARPYGAEWDIGAFEYVPIPGIDPFAVDPNITSLHVYNNIITKSGNTSAMILCNLKEAGKLSLKIYDAKGKEIIVLCNEHKTAGIHTLNWAGVDSSDGKVGSGIYIVHMKSGGNSETKKIAIVK